MTHDTHQYLAELAWTGNHGSGTARYDDYGRGFELRFAGKPPLQGSADPAFRGDPGQHNPEDLLLAAIASCHMLSYLALCARHRICVMAYSDRAVAVMQTTAAGGGRFISATLQPRVVLRDADHIERATALHAQARALCFIANSCNFPIDHRAVVVAQGADAAAAVDTASRPPEGDAA